MEQVVDFGERASGGSGSGLLADQRAFEADLETITRFFDFKDVVTRRLSLFRECAVASSLYAGIT